MDNARQTLGPVDAAEAVRLGLFVDVAYQMYQSDPTNSSPPAPALPDAYKFLAWVQMRDFLFASGALAFYGLVAQSPDASETILAMRGTNDPTEWWDDLLAIVPASWNGVGSVGFGFNQIYRTLRIVQPQQPAAAPASPLARSAKAPVPFAEQMAGLLRQHAHTTAEPGKMASAVAKPLGPLKVVGHSLGSALATLYVAENVQTGHVQVPLICTFASPRVGDHDFAAAFDALPVESWRIVNELDVVPKVPWIGFEHVVNPYTYNSASVANPSWGCSHNLDTYFHLLDPAQPIPGGCQKAKVAPRMAATRTAVAASGALRETDVTVPIKGGATVTITVRVEATD